jgi:hypothetical protein
MNQILSTRPQRFAVIALALTVLLAGCDSPVRLMPTPVSFRTGAIDPFEQAGTTAKGTDVPVLYVTNRGAVIEKPEPIHTILPSDRLRMGVAHVRIGDDTLDWDTLHRLSTSDDLDERPIVKLDLLEPIASLGANDTVADSPDAPDAQAFFALVNKALEASSSRDLLVYLHGSNNTLPRAAAPAAQLRHFIGRRRFPDGSVASAGFRRGPRRSERHPHAANQLACLLVRRPMGQQRPARPGAVEGGTNAPWPGASGQRGGHQVLDVAAGFRYPGQAVVRAGIAWRRARAAGTALGRRAASGASRTQAAQGFVRSRKVGAVFIGEVALSGGQRRAPLGWPAAHGDDTAGQIGLPEPPVVDVALAHQQHAAGRQHTFAQPHLRCARAVRQRIGLRRQREQEEALSRRVLCQRPFSGRREAELGIGDVQAALRLRAHRGCTGQRQQGEQGSSPDGVIEGWQHARSPACRRQESARRSARS